LGLFGRELEHEVLGESLPVTFESLIQDSSVDAIEMREVVIKHDLVVPEKVNPMLNDSSRNKCSGRMLGHYFSE